MQREKTASGFIDHVPAVVEETRDQPEREAAGLSPYQIAEDLCRLHPEFRRSVERVGTEGVIGADNSVHENYPPSGHMRRVCHITTTVGTHTVAGSGAFIAPRLVLTAAHVVRPTGTAPDKVRVIPAAYRRGHENGDVIFPFGEQSTNETRVHPRYVHSDVNRAQYDVGVIALPDDSLYRSVGERYGVMVPTNQLLDKYRPGSREFYTINPYGYPGDKAMYSMWCTGLSRITGYDGLTMLTDADIVPGQSGSAVIHDWGMPAAVMGVVVHHNVTANTIKRIDEETFRHLQAWMDEFR